MSNILRNLVVTEVKDEKQKVETITVINIKLQLTGNELRIF